jgi:hypothetical protein
MSPNAYDHPIFAQHLLGFCGGDYWHIEKIESGEYSIITSNDSLLLNGEPLAVSIIAVAAKFPLFQTKPRLPVRSWRVQSGVSSDLLR